MAIVTVPSNPYTNGDNLIVNFTTDVTNITDVQLTNDGSNYISATSFSNTLASFNVSSWNSGTYSTCYLKVIYTETTPTPTPNTYNITYNLTNCSKNNTNTSIAEGESYSCTITSNDGYTIDSITVTMGGNNITSSAVSGNTITINSVSGDIVITAVATETSSGGDTNTYTITYNLSNCISNNNNTIIDKGGSYTALITPNSDYTMRSITVMMGGTDVTSTVVNNYTINITNVTGNIVITATATQSSSGDASQDALVYSLPSETTFTGSNYIDTGVRLFTSNTDWTIFIDYQLADTTQANKQLFSCTTKTDTSNKVFGMYMYSQRCMLYGTGVGSAIKINDATGDTSRRKIAITKSGSNLIINHDTTNSWDVANGYTQQFTYNSTTYSSITNSLVLGVDNSNPEAFIDYFIGTIYQCKIYNKALSDSEITTLLG